VHEFIAALRQLRFPIVALAVAILVLQALVAGLASAHAAVRLANFSDIAVLCQGNSDDGAPSGAIAHDCCKFCGVAAPAVLSRGLISLGSVEIVRFAGVLAPLADPKPAPRAIRAGPSQAPPLVS
jgi:hypothetical protein